MGLPEEQSKGIRLAVVIHDIGKINVPAKLLSTPRRMTDIEFSLTKKHSEAGREMLRDIDSSASISSQVGQVKVPILSLKGCQIARLVHYRLLVLALESEAISSTIRGVKVLRSSSTPVFRTLPFDYCVEGFPVDGN